MPSKLVKKVVKNNKEHPNETNEIKLEKLKLELQKLKDEIILRIDRSENRLANNIEYVHEDTRDAKEVAERISEKVNNIDSELKYLNRGLLACFHRYGVKDGFVVCLKCNQFFNKITND